MTRVNRVGLVALLAFHAVALAACTRSSTLLSGRDGSSTGFDDGSAFLSEDGVLEPGADGGTPQLVGDASAEDTTSISAGIDASVTDGASIPFDAGNQDQPQPIDASWPAQGPYTKIALEVSTEYHVEPSGTWLMADYDRDGSPDLVFIKDENTGTGSVEVHISSGASKYQTRIYADGTVFDLSSAKSGVWRMVDQDTDGVPDLADIKTANTGTGKVEVHVASGASKYRTFIVHAGTWFQPETDGTWLLADYDKDLTPDLVFVKTANTGTGKVEVHIASGASTYQQLLLQTGTVFPLEAGGTWLMADYDRDGVPDLVFITSNTTTGKVEVSIASGASKYQTSILHAVSAFDSDSQATWLMANLDQDGVPDLVYVKPQGTALGNVVVSVASSIP